MRVNVTVNGRQVEADDVWEGESLLYVLRERLGLPGSKNACEQGECGSCTVRLDGIPVCSCLVAAGQVEGREVVTVEGLAEYAQQRGAGGRGHSPSYRWGHPHPRAERCGGSSGACGTSVSDAQLGAPPDEQARPSNSELRSPAASDSQTGENAELSPIQQAFIDAGAVQCGFCTPGLLVAADELLERNPSPSDADIREALSGNLCRCTGYEKILDAVRLAAARGEAETAGTGA